MLFNPKLERKISLNKKNIIFLLVTLVFTFTYITSIVNVSAARSMESSESGLNHKSASSTSDNTEEEYYFDKNCTDLAPALRIGGLVITVVKVAIPTIIIILGIFSLFSSVLRIIKLATQIVIAALIFFTPNIINSFVSVMTKDKNSDIDVCRMCLLENNCPVPDKDSWYEYKS